MLAHRKMVVFERFSKRNCWYYFVLGIILQHTSTLFKVSIFPSRLPRSGLRGDQ